MNFDKIHSKDATFTWLDMHSFGSNLSSRLEDEDILILCGAEHLNHHHNQFDASEQNDRPLRTNLSINKSYFKSQIKRERDVENQKTKK